MFQLFGFVVLIFVVGTAANTELLREESNVHHVAFSNVVQLMVTRFVSPKTNTLVVMEKCKTCHKQGHNFHTRLLEHFISHFSSTMTLQLFFGKPDDKLWDYNLFIVDGEWSFRELCRQIPETTHEREFYFFIVVTRSPADPAVRKSTMEKIFEICWQLNIFNAVILLDFIFYAYTPFQRRSCSRMPYIDEVNSFYENQLKHDYLFPPRLLDLNNCTLRVSAHVLHPFLFFKGNRTNPNHQKNMTLLSGIDGDILKLLARDMHFRIQLSFPLGRHTIGLSNNSTASFAELDSGSVEIAIGGFGKSLPNHHILSSSLPYYHTTYVFVVRSGLHFGAIKQLALPFQRYVWCMLGITLLFAMLAIAIVTSYARPQRRAFIFGARNHHPSSNLFTILLGNPISILPRRNFARFLLMSWLLLTLVLRNAYQAKMFDSLRLSRRTPLPHSIDELKAQKYIFVNGIYTDFYPHNMTIIIPELIDRLNVVQESSNRMATFSLLDTMAYYNLINRTTSQLTYVNEPVYIYQLVMFFKKNSHLRAVFNEKLKRLVHSGITKHIATKYVKKKYTLMNEGEWRVPSISNTTLRGLYIVYGILIQIAALSFGLELWSRRSRRIRRLLDWIHYGSNNQ